MSGTIDPHPPADVEAPRRGIWAQALARSFDGAIDALERALRECPEQLWEECLWAVRRTDPFAWPADEKGGSGVGTEAMIWVREGGEAAPRGRRTDEALQVFSTFWYIAYHGLFFLDYYLSRGEDDGFAPPAPFRDEHGLDPDGAGLFPYRVYTREELLGYVAHDRRKARATVGAITDGEAERPCGPGSPHAGRTFADLLLTNLAHTVAHTSQLAMFLGQRAQP